MCKNFLVIILNCKILGQSYVMPWKNPNVSECVWRMDVETQISSRVISSDVYAMLLHMIEVWPNPMKNCNLQQNLT